MIIMEMMLKNMKIIMIIIINKILEKKKKNE